MYPRVEIPEQHVPYFAKLLRLDRSQQDELVAGLATAPPTLYIRDLAASLASRVHIPEIDLYEILLMFAGMYEGARRGENLAQFVDLVVDAAKERENLRDSSTDWESIRTLISSVLRLDSTLGVTSKALGVTSDHERVYCSSRVLTDIRTVFSEGEVKPAAATIVHTLRVSFHEGGTTSHSPRSLYIAMDAGDIELLLKQLERAKEKERHLKEMLQKTDVPVLSAEVR